MLTRDSGAAAATDAYDSGTQPLADSIASGRWLLQVRS